MPSLTVPTAALSIDSTAFNHDIRLPLEPQPDHDQGVAGQVHGELLCYSLYHTISLTNALTPSPHDSLNQAFCGSIHNIEMHEGNKAVVTFEKPSAASTALMLNGEYPLVIKTTHKPGGIDAARGICNRQVVVRNAWLTNLIPTLIYAGGTLDGSPIHVSSEDVSEDTPSTAGDLHDHDDIPQEAKPRYVQNYSKRLQCPRLAKC